MGRMGRFCIEIWPRSELAAKKREDYFRELKTQGCKSDFHALTGAESLWMTDDKGHEGALRGAEPLSAFAVLGS
ncbi:MAG TPA: hypothetical protein VFQ41_25760 [Candidatus Angelobacter sp.]|nr:hypothetical protein [Candidatus Angelobacter sp.]